MNLLLRSLSVHSTRPGVQSSYPGLMWSRDFGDTDVLKGIFKV